APAGPGGVSPRKQPARPWVMLLAGLALLAVLVAVPVAVLVSARPDGSGQAAGGAADAGDPPSAPGARPISEGGPIATLTDVQGAKFIASELPTRVGAALRPGWVKLTAGR